MTPLRLVESPDRADEGAVRLRPGRHGLPADLVSSHQRQRIFEAAATALGEQGYGRITASRVIELAGVSSSTFYDHFEDLWSCLPAAYEAEADHLLKEVEAACAVAEGDLHSQARAGIGAALDFLASEPAVARLLSAEPPPQVAGLVSVRLDLTERLGAMLRSARRSDDAPVTPPALERRLVGAALALVSTYVVGDEAECLPELEPALSEFLLAPL